MQALQSPLPFFTDTDGSPLSLGYLYLGVENDNPETNPATVFWDAAGTQPVAQPVRTLNGYPTRNGQPALIYFSAPVALTVKNRRGVLILYARSTRDLTVGFLNPMTTAGDVIVGVTAGAAARLPIGTAGQVLTVAAGAPAWVSPVVGFVNPMTAAGDIIRGGALGAAGRLAIGADGQVLTAVSGLPVWQALPSVALPTYFGFSARRITSDQATSGVIVFNDVAGTGLYIDSVNGTPVYDAGTGRFTAPETRRYSVRGGVTIHNGGGAGTTVLELRINGSVLLSRDVSVDAGTSNDYAINLSLSLVQSDYVEIASPSLGGGVVVKTGSHFSIRAE